MVALTEGGHLFFEAYLAGPEVVPFVNDRALLVALRDGSVHTVLRRGQAVDVAGDGSDLRALADWSLGGVTDTLHLPLRLELADGSEGVFLGTVRLE